MRLLLELECLHDGAYDLQYFSKLQGLIYGLLKGTVYDNLHDEKGYKFFCYSNVFPIGDFRAGDKRRLLISSPNVEFLQILYEKLPDTLNLGQNRYRVLDAKPIETRITTTPLTIATATPIVIRIPKQNYEKYGISTEKNYEYAYWKPEHSFEAFLKQLQENIVKKYQDYTAEKIEAPYLFQDFMFKKTVANHVVRDGKESTIIGSIWQFSFSHLTGEQNELLEFAIDCGFGEMNPSGFGFMNVMRPKPNQAAV